MGDTAGDLLGFGGERWEVDPLGSSGEEGGDPSEHVPLDANVVESFDQHVVGYGVEACREVKEDQSCCFSLVEEGSDVVGGRDQVGFSALIAAIAGLGGIE